MGNERFATKNFRRRRSNHREAAFGRGCGLRERNPKALQVARDLDNKVREMLAEAAGSQSLSEPLRGCVPQGDHERSSVIPPQWRNVRGPLWRAGLRAAG